MPDQKIIFDANAIIKLHQLSLWTSIVHICHVAVTPIIRRESKFYKNGLGQKKEIDFSSDIANQKIEEVSVSLESFKSFSEVLKDSFLEGIDEGEREAIAFLYASKEKGSYRFCTLDRLAIKCLGVLGLRFHGISMEELFGKYKIKVKLSGENLRSGSKETFERMLSEGFQETHLHMKQPLLC